MLKSTNYASRQFLQFLHYVSTWYFDGLAVMCVLNESTEIFSTETCNGTVINAVKPPII